MNKFLSITMLTTGTLLLASCGSSNKEQTKQSQTDEGVQKMSRIKTPTGLEYEVIKEGTGAVAQKGQKATVHYTGWLVNDDGSKGTKFDSSLDRGQPFTFNLGAGQVIKGWDEGVAGMMVGEKRTLIIPAHLGYGTRGAGAAIPGNATLLFEVELLEVKG